MHIKNDIWRRFDDYQITIKFQTTNKKAIEKESEMKLICYCKRKWENVMKRAEQGRWREEVEKERKRAHLITKTKNRKISESYQNNAMPDRAQHPMCRIQMIQKRRKREKRKKIYWYLFYLRIVIRM